MTCQHTGCNKPATCIYERQAVAGVAGAGTFAACTRHAPVYILGGVAQGITELVWLDRVPRSVKVRNARRPIEVISWSTESSSNAAQLARLA